MKGYPDTTHHSMAGSRMLSKGTQHKVTESIYHCHKEKRGQSWDESNIEIISLKLRII
jgi:hypothetical protein